MIAIIVIRASSFGSLFSLVDSFNRKKNPPFPWKVITINRFKIDGVSIARVALVCSEPPPPEWGLLIEGTVSDRRYCPVCLKDGKFTPLAEQNRSGYCKRHREFDPVRIAKKRSPRNR